MLNSPETLDVLIRLPCTEVNFTPPLIVLVMLGGFFHAAAEAAISNGDGAVER